MDRKSIHLTPAIFQVLFEELKQKLALKYNVAPDLMSDFQLFGYANFDEESPSIKRLVYDETQNWINGKYLYNKYKQYKSGEKRIGLSREYIYVFFQTLGYDDFHMFLNSSPYVDEASMKEQLSGLKIAKREEDEHFVAYYLGENEEVISTYLHIYNNFRSAKWSLYYWEQDNEVSEYLYFGKVSLSQNSFAMYFSSDDSEVHRSAFVGISHDVTIKYKPIFCGCYVGFDKSMRPVSGEVIFLRQKSDFKPDLQAIRQADPIIVQYLTKKRIIADNQFPETLYDLSVKSKFAFQLNDLVGKYGGIIQDTVNEKRHLVVMEIRGNTMHCTLQTNHTIYRGFLKSLSNGVVHGEFVSGLEDERISVYLKAQLDQQYVLTGRLSGFSKFLQIISGELILSRKEEDIEKIKLLYTEGEHQAYPEVFHTFLKNSVGRKPTTIPNTHQVDHLVGCYKIYSREDEHINTMCLEITKKGSATLHKGLFVYEGVVKLYGMRILVIDLLQVNEATTPGQLLFFVGLLEGVNIKQCSGTWQYLDYLGRPRCDRVFMCHEKHALEDAKAPFEPDEPSSIISNNQILT